MNFLRNMLEDLEVLSKFTVEIFNARGEKVDEVKVIAGNDHEAESLALHKSRKGGADAVTAVALDKQDMDMDY